MKRISILVLVIALCTVLVGCGEKDEIMSNNNNENVTQNQENTDLPLDDENNDNDNRDDQTSEESNNTTEESETTEKVEVVPVEIKEEDNTMTVRMFDLYDIVFKFDGEKVVESYSKYTFYSEQARDSFVAEYKDAPEGEVSVDGMTVTIKNDDSQFENLTKTQIMEEFQSLKTYYDTEE